MTIDEGGRLVDLGTEIMVLWEQRTKRNLQGVVKKNQ